MKTGIELIAQERQEQIEKHGRTIQLDVENNAGEQLIIGAIALITPDHVKYGLEGTSDEDRFEMMPAKWDSDICNRMCKKGILERLIIAGALIAAEIDRLQHS